MSRTRSRSKGRAQTSGQGQARGKGQAKGQPKGTRPATSGGATRSADSVARSSPQPGAGRPAGNGSGILPTAQAGTAAEARSGGAARAALVGEPPNWVRLTTLILSLAGLGVSIYLTITHYSTAVSLACPDTGAVNCEKVTTSPESIVFGVPLAVLGLAFFVFMVAVNNPLGWRSPLRIVHLARLLSVIIGIGFVVYLIYVELFKVSAICLWCTSVHAITFALFVLILFSAATWGLAERSK
jgi:uncharacterized membrane protein